jgi:hypothetical protein
VILTAHQPVYLPWLGLFQKIQAADLFCVFDIVQYQKKDFNNRNKIKTKNGEMWLSVPVESKGYLDKKIHDIKILEDGWRRKHYKSIYFAYEKSIFFDKYIGDFEKIIFHGKQKFLTDLNFEILTFLLKSLNISTPIVKASDYNFTGHKSDLVLDMCMKLNADTYIFGELGRNYVDIKSFSEKNINVLFQNYQHPKYKQLHGDFSPYMSVIDLLFNHGPNSFSILTNDRSPGMIHE